MPTSSGCSRISYPFTAWHFNARQPVAAYFLSQGSVRGSETYSYAVPSCASHQPAAFCSGVPDTTCSLPSLSTYLFHLIAILCYLWIFVKPKIGPPHSVAPSVFSFTPQGTPGRFLLSPSHRAGICIFHLILSIPVPVTAATANSAIASAWPSLSLYTVPSSFKSTTAFNPTSVPSIPKKAGILASVRLSFS